MITPYVKLPKERRKKNNNQNMAQMVSQLVNRTLSRQAETKNISYTVSPVPTAINTS
jgi:hypothetical protein